MQGLFLFMLQNKRCLAFCRYRESGITSLYKLNTYSHTIPSAMSGVLSKSPFSRPTVYPQSFFGSSLSFHWEAPRSGAHFLPARQARAPSLLLLWSPRASSPLLPSRQPASFLSFLPSFFPFSSEHCRSYSQPPRFKHLLNYAYPRASSRRHLHQISRHTFALIRPVSTCKSFAPGSTNPRRTHPHPESHLRARIFLDPPTRTNKFTFFPLPNHQPPTTTLLPSLMPRRRDILNQLSC